MTSLARSSRAKQGLSSFPDDLHQSPFTAPAVELPVEDLLPGAEIEPSPRHGHDDLSPHDLTLQVGIAVVLARPVVPVAGDRLVGGQFIQPFLVIPVKPRLVVVDEHRGRDVHGIYQAHILCNHIP